MHERVIELPWALERYRGEQVVLDIGYANAGSAYVECLKRLHIPKLYGLDLVYGPGPKFIRTLGDIRQAPYPDRFFEFILCISTLEHVGQDNTLYGTPSAPKCNGDFQAMRELYRLLRPGSRAIVTVPFGAPREMGWQIQYDAARFDQLLTTSPFEIVEAEYFGYLDGWVRCSRESLAKAEYGKDAPNAAGLACAELRRPIVA
jgi:hypothetical protein